MLRRAAAFESFRSGRSGKLTSFITLLLFSLVYALAPVTSAYAQQQELEQRKERRLQQIEQRLTNSPEKKLAFKLQGLKDKLAGE